MGRRDSAMLLDLHRESVSPKLIAARVLEASGVIAQTVTHFSTKYGLGGLPLG